MEPAWEVRPGDIEEEEGDTNEPEKKKKEKDTTEDRRVQTRGKTSLSVSIVTSAW